MQLFRVHNDMKEKKTFGGNFDPFQTIYMGKNICGISKAKTNWCFTTALESLDCNEIKSLVNM